MSGDAVTKLNQFRSELYSLFPKRRDAIMNLLDALTSDGYKYKSVVQLSHSPFFQRQYSSITDAIADGLTKVEWDDICRLVDKYTETKLPEANAKTHRFVLDCSPNPRPFARKLEDRTITHYPNPAPGNKPICIGHQYSLLSRLPDEILENEKHWLVPLGAKRVQSHQKGNELGMEQMNECIETLELGDDLFISVADSLYGSESCRAKVSTHKNWVHIFRLNSSRNVFQSVKPNEVKAKGRKKSYGAKMNLGNADTHVPCDRECTVSKISKKGQAYTIGIKCWDDMIFRGSRQFRADEHPLNVIQITVFNAAGDAVFKRPLWIGVLGERRHEVSLEEAYRNYDARYDIEHLFRFGKTKLMMAGFQTSEVEHEEVWWKLCTLAYVQLYLAKEFASCLPEPWERYLLSFKDMETQEKKVLTPSQTQRGFSKVLEQIGTPAQPVIARGKPCGRMSGETQPKKEKQPVIFKSKKPENTNNPDSENLDENSSPQKIAALIKLVHAKIEKTNLSVTEFTEKLLNTS